MNRYWGTKN